MCIIFFLFLFPYIQCFIQTNYFPFQDGLSICYSTDTGNHVTIFFSKESRIIPQRLKLKIDSDVDGVKTTVTENLRKVKGVCPTFFELINQGSVAIYEFQLLNLGFEYLIDRYQVKNLGETSTKVINVPGMLGITIIKVKFVSSLPQKNKGKKVSSNTFTIKPNSKNTNPIQNRTCINFLIKQRKFELKFDFLKPLTINQYDWYILKFFVTKQNEPEFGKLLFVVIAQKCSCFTENSQGIHKKIFTETSTNLKIGLYGPDDTELASSIYRKLGKGELISDRERSDFAFLNLMIYEMIRIKLRTLFDSRFDLVLSHIDQIHRKCVIDQREMFLIEGQSHLVVTRRDSLHWKNIKDSKISFVSPLNDNQYEKCLRTSEIVHSIPFPTI